MTSRRIIFFAVLLLFLYLGMYTWNQRTGALDDASAAIGLEAAGALLKPLAVVEGAVTEFWERYLDLVSVREENERLKADLIAVQGQLIQIGEDRAELVRLRNLLTLPPDRAWTPLGVRVIAGRMGPNAGLETIIISRGYLTGATPGVPVVTGEGLVGRVMRASGHVATVLLLTNPGSRIAVLSQKTRTPGVLTGRGSAQLLEMRFVGRNARVQPGELLVTSGLDGAYPKGIAVARVSSVAPSDFSQFMQVMATPLVNAEHLEEVLLLDLTGEPTAAEVPVDINFIGPPDPSTLVKALIGGTDAERGIVQEPAPVPAPPVPDVLPGPPERGRRAVYPLGGAPAPDTPHSEAPRGRR